MPAYLGRPGAYVEFAHWREKQSVSGSRPTSTRTTLGGNRVAFRSARSHREWDLQATEIDQEEAVGIETLVLDGLGPGPHRLIDPHAQVTNVITPERSLVGRSAALDGVIGSAVDSSPVRLPGGAIVPSLSSGGGSVTLMTRAPVMPGKSATASVHVSPGASVKIKVAGRDGVFLRDLATVNATGSDDISRVGYTYKVVASDAWYLFFEVTGATRIAAPAVTWTDEILPWSVGQGCDSVVITKWDKDYSNAAPQSGARRDVNISVTAMEVGLGA